MRRCFRNLHFFRALALGFLSFTLSACGPKQQQIQHQDDWDSQGQPFLTSCNQVDIDNSGYFQVSEKSGAKDHVILKFSQNPLATDDTPIHITKWDGNFISSTLVQLRARMWVNGRECALTTNYESGTFTKDRIDFLKTRMQESTLVGGCGVSAGGNFFSKIEFLIEGVDDSWKGLSIFRGQSSANSEEVASGLLPPFYLQYSYYAKNRPVSLHEYHPLYLETDKTPAQLENLAASYCSLF